MTSNHATRPITYRRHPRTLGFQTNSRATIGSVIVSALWRIAVASASDTRPRTFLPRDSCSNKPVPSSRKPHICASFQITAITQLTVGKSNTRDAASAAMHGGIARRAMRYAPSKKVQLCSASIPNGPAST
ncbi:MAG: hypothetical protein HC863_01545 [Myxococcales bacterium]|nr:hypothetical protein [Myxococcales bacterium]